MASRVRPALTDANTHLLTYPRIIDVKRTGLASTYAQAWNQKLAEQLQATLPRELRDMIYTYLWTYETTDCSLSRMFDIFRTGFRQSTINNLKRLKKGPFFTNPVFVGQVTALEVVEVFYRIAVPGFHIRKPEDLKLSCLKIRSTWDTMRQGC